MNGRYSLAISRPAEMGLVRRIAPEHAGRIRRAIENLAEDPRPRGARKMRGTGGTEDWRVRVGDYRIIYRVDDEAMEILVLEVGHRGSIYG